MSQRAEQRVRAQENETVCAVAVFAERKKRRFDTFEVRVAASGQWPGADDSESKIEFEGDITALCDAYQGGDELAGQELFRVIYDELRIIARAHRRRWRGNDTLNTTALIHETYLKLTDHASPNWKNRKHFFATAAKAMRHVLVNYAERSNAEKRGGKADNLSLPDDVPEQGATLLQLLELHQALEQLEGVQPRRCRVVECRIFGGMGNEQIAEALGISLATVKRDWTLARAELYQLLSEPNAS